MPGPHVHPFCLSRPLQSCNVGTQQLLRKLHVDAAGSARADDALLQVYSQCKLTGPNIGNVVGVDSLGTWEVCTSPQARPARPLECASTDLTACAAAFGLLMREEASISGMQWTAGVLCPPLLIAGQAFQRLWCGLGALKSYLRHGPGGVK